MSSDEYSEEGECSDVAPEAVAADTPAIVSAAATSLPIALKRAKRERSSSDELPTVRKLVKFDMAGEKHQQYFSYNMHDLDGCSPPFNRTEKLGSRRNHEARPVGALPCVIEVGDQAWGNFNKATSDMRLVFQECASLPMLGVRVKKGKQSTEIDYEEISANDTIEFDLDKLEGLRFDTFNIRSLASASLAKELQAVMMKKLQFKAQDDEHFFNNGRRQDFVRVELRRSSRPANRSKDFSHFSDAALDWNPPDTLKVGDQEPYRPRTTKHREQIQDAIVKMKAAEVIVFWVFVGLTNDSQRYFNNFTSLLNRTLGRESPGKINTDWYWNLHPSYERSDIQSPWQKFQTPPNKPPVTHLRRPWPERQPWLHIKDGQFRQVWNEAKTRFAGVTAYESTMAAATLMEMEDEPLRHRQQFNDTQTYPAVFERVHDDRYIIKVKLAGVHARDDAQVIPTPGTLVQLWINGESLEKNDAWQGTVAKNCVKDYDMVFASQPPGRYLYSPPAAKTHEVIITTETIDMSGDRLLGAISGAATLTKTRSDAPDDISKRRAFHVGNVVCGDLVQDDSPDIFGDWKAKQSPGDATQAIVDEIFNKIPAMFNTRQYKAYLLLLRGSPGGLLAVEGLPGCGKSYVMSGIACALILMGVRIMICAQSNNGVCQVFSKVIAYLEKHHPHLLPTILRLGAASVEESIADQLKDGNIDERFLWLAANSDNPLAKDRKAWLDARARHESAFRTEKLKPPNEDIESEASIKSQVFKHAVKPDELLLLGITAAAAARLEERVTFDAEVLIFDELSQATEPIFLIPLVQQRDLKSVLICGDTKQLGPVVMSARSSPYGQQVALSPLERLTKRKEFAHIKLNLSYRSHPAILVAPSMIVYKDAGFESGLVEFPAHAGAGKLIEDSDEITQILGGLFKKQFPLAEGGGRVWFNPNGTAAVVRLARAFAPYFGAKNVKVISVYAYEVERLQTYLHWLCPGVEVCTVDSFQGGEADLVIVHFSAAFTSRLNPFGFAADLKRMNVAITRAKQMSILVGNHTYWAERCYVYEGAEPAANDPALLDKEGGRKQLIKKGTNPLIKLVDLMYSRQEVVQWQHQFQPYDLDGLQERSAQMRS
ncbi:P-loop containing nucleoside triphosphate hydrolase protein [Boeremia exigua]|uniref:P-loop containing nucleoside triphosphate hydrolase protein n=1 Tax=Boeremia exigua TaxID=749465 RepID=UPI001E8DF262|nr:P-loop containing nucleoside triphosphate hydrolase protein [Boeremia exigua]KAH6629685.1 P-loop containing nucleoside triphosphate hydrolase protein [Boeremia exigua]